MMDALSQFGAKTLQFDRFDSTRFDFDFIFDAHDQLDVTAVMHSNDEIKKLALYTLMIQLFAGLLEEVMNYGDPTGQALQPLDRKTLRAHPLTTQISSLSLLYHCDNKLLPKSCESMKALLTNRHNNRKSEGLHRCSFSCNSEEHAPYSG